MDRIEIFLDFLTVAFALMFATGLIIAVIVVVGLVVSAILKRVRGRATTDEGATFGAAPTPAPYNYLGATIVQIWSYNPRTHKWSYIGDVCEDETEENDDEQ